MGAGGIEVQIHRSPGSDPALAADERGLRRRSIAGLGALPPLLLALYFTVQRIVPAWRRDPNGELLIIAAALVFMAVVLVVQLRRLTPRTVKPGQLWCSKTAIYSGPFDDTGGIEHSAEFAQAHSKNSLAPIVRLVLTPSSILILPWQGDKQRLECNLSDVQTIGVSWAGRHSSGVTITRRDGHVARFLFKPEQKLVDELRRLGATVTVA